MFIKYRSSFSSILSSSDGCWEKCSQRIESSSWPYNERLDVRNVARTPRSGKRIFKLDIKEESSCV